MSTAGLQLWKVCEGQGLRRGGFCLLLLTHVYLSVSRNSLVLITLVAKHVSQMTMAFFSSFPLFNSLLFFFLNRSLIKLRILAQGFINMCY